ncbi:MAG: BcII family subclass B1 metallo-beta-lactamase [Salibacteraceae bacterium]
MAGVTSAKNDTIQVSEYLQIVPLSKHCFLHISYIPYKDKPFQCNGMVYIKNGEAAVFDTPIGDEASQNLIQWIFEEHQASIKYLVINHFHEDCISGITSFVGTGCQSISQQKMCRLADLKGYNCTQRYFTESMTIDVGGTQIENRFFGAAHTEDNIVSYVPDDRVLFGGCMIKALGAGRGNTQDADLSQWSRTVSAVAEAYPKVKLVIPGHGDPGNKRLYRYTIDLFSE